MILLAIIVILQQSMTGIGLAMFALLFSTLAKVEAKSVKISSQRSGSGASAMVGKLPRLNFDSIIAKSLPYS